MCSYDNFSKYSICKLSKTSLQTDGQVFVAFFDVERASGHYSGDPIQMDFVNGIWEQELLQR